MQPQVAFFFVGGCFWAVVALKGCGRAPPGSKAFFSGVEKHHEKQRFSPAPAPAEAQPQILPMRQTAPALARSPSRAVAQPAAQVAAAPSAARAQPALAVLAPPASKTASQPASRTNAARFQAWIYARQHDLAKTRGPNGPCTERIQVYDKKIGGGFFSKLSQMARQLAVALADDEMFMLHRGDRNFYTNPEWCPTRTYDCYFEPLSACDDAKRMGVNVSHLPRALRIKDQCTPLSGLEKRLHHLAGLDGDVETETWFEAQLRTRLNKIE